MTSIIRRAAFTITELLVVISIIVLLMAIAVPAFSSLLGSSERSLAENQMKAALSAARDAAIQSEAGDAAAVFYYTPGGRFSVVTCVSMGRMPVQDIDQDPTAPPREVFVPVPSSEPMQMPKGWSIRGLAAEGTVFNPGTTGITQREHWYRSYFNGTGDDTVEGDTGWVFPENAMYENPAQVSVAFATLAANNARVPQVMGAGRRTFIVRFKVGTGEVDLSNRDSVLIFDPYMQASFRSAAPYSAFRSDQLRIRGTPSPNAATYVRRLLADPQLNDFSTPAAQNRSIGYSRALLGIASPDTILARPVSELALYQEKHLIAGIGSTRGANAVTGTLWENTSATPHFEIDSTTLPAGVSDQRTLSLVIRNWIEGRDSAGPGVPPVREPFDARIFTLTRYLGQTEEVKP